MTKENKPNKFEIKKYFAKYRVPIFVYLLALFIGSVCEIFFALYVAKVMVAITEANYMLAVRRFIVVTVALLLMQVLYYFDNLLYTIYSTKIVKDMRLDIAYQAFKLSDATYLNHNTANFTQRIASDPQTILSQLRNITNYLNDLIAAGIMVVYISFFNIYIGLITLVIIFGLFVINVTRKKLYKKNRKQLHKADEATNSLLQEVIRSEKDIKSLNLEEKLRDEIKAKAEVGVKQSIKTDIIDNTFNRLRNFFMHLTNGALVCTALLLKEYNLISLSALLIIYTNRRYPIQFSLQLSDMLNMFTEISIALSRINELYLDEEYEMEHFGNQELTNAIGKIEFKNVTFSYPEYRQKTQAEIELEKKENKKNHIKTKINPRVEIGKKKVIDKMNFEIEPNTTVAFVGKSGSGKTTVVNLISRLFLCDSGKILIDGKDLKKLNKQSVRNTIALVNQFPYIFDMSIKDNLLLAKPTATDDEIDKAIKDSALKEFVDTLPDKLNTIVGESGVKLSGGQKQRLAIARAMLKNSKIIIFDESTSSLDNLAQNQVKKSIYNIKGKSTVIIVAHRLSTIKNVDKIFFLDNGKIVDTGTFKELYKTNKDFKTLFNAEEI